MRSPGDRQRNAGGMLQDWHRGTCLWFQQMAKSAQELHQRVLQESAGAVQHLQQQNRRHGQHRAASGSAFGSLAAAPANHQAKRIRFRGKGVNCIVSDLADSSQLSLPPPRAQGNAASSKTAGSEEEERILISEVEVVGVEGALKEAAEQVLAVKPNFSYTLQEVREQIGNIYDLGWFKTVEPLADDTRDGIKLSIQIEPHPQIRGVAAEGAKTLPVHVIEDAFRHQYDRTLNLGDFRAALAKLDGWYADRGIFGQVTEVHMDDGNVVKLKMAEMQVGKLNLKFQDKKTGDIKDEGKTKPEVILRHLSTKPGEVYSLQLARRDIDAVYSMGLFEDVKFLPQASEDSSPDAPTVDLTLQVKERKPTSLSAGLGISSQSHAEGAMPGFIGSCSYSQRNLFGLNQKLVASCEAGQNDSTFRISHTDPWVNGDAHRTSRIISLQQNRTSGNLIHAKASDEGTGQQTQTTGPEGNVMVGRLMGAVEYGRPLAQHWSGTAGINFQRAHCSDDHGKKLTRDCYDGPLTFSGGEYDTMMVTLLRGVYTGHNDSQLVLSMEQSVPFLKGWLNFNRLRVRAERSVPLPLINGLKLYGCAKGGAIIGDLPPYEAFPIGGTASVRGYGEGAVGSGRHYVAGTAEVHFPIAAPIEGTVLIDFGSDLGSGDSVPGDPAGARGKAGNGWGVGGGVRIASPVGPLRLEWARNKEGGSRMHLGIGAHA